MMEAGMLSMDELLREISTRESEFESGKLPVRSDFERIQSDVAALLQAPVYRQPEQEYIHSDGLAVYYSEEGRPLAWPLSALTKNPAFVVYIRISWVAPYIMLDWKKSGAGREWRTIADGQLPHDLDRISDKIRLFLESSGNQVLSGPILDRSLPGRTSELDDAEQTVREALFSALD